MNAIAQFFSKPNLFLFFGSIILVELAVYARYTFRKNQHPVDKGMGSFFSATFGGLAWLAFWFSATAGLPGNTVLVRGKTVVASFPEQHFEWAWKYGPDEMRSYNSVIDGEKMVEALTANPGIRRVQIHVKVQVGGTVEEFAAYLRSDWGDDPSSRLKSALNRFEKTYHSYIAENCFDDQDPKQQIELEKKFSQFIAPEISGKGVQVASVKFVSP